MMYPKSTSGCTNCRRNGTYCLYALGREILRALWMAGFKAPINTEPGCEQGLTGDFHFPVPEFADDEGSVDIKRSPAKMIDGKPHWDDPKFVTELDYSGNWQLPWKTTGRGGMVGNSLMVDDHHERFLGFDETEIHRRVGLEALGEGDPPDDTTNPKVRNFVYSEELDEDEDSVAETSDEYNPGCYVVTLEELAAEEHWEQPVSGEKKLGRVVRQRQRVRLKGPVKRTLRYSDDSPDEVEIRFTLWSGYRRGGDDAKIESDSRLNLCPSYLWHKWLPDKRGKYVWRLPRVTPLREVMNVIKSRVAWWPIRDIWLTLETGKKVHLPGLNDMRDWCRWHGASRGQVKYLDGLIARRQGR